nr:AzicU5 [Kibdelosporangium sp. MJ126-NF4]
MVSARPIAVAADTPVICSAGGTHPQLLARLRDSGLPVGTDLRVFRSEADFADRVAEAISDGLLMSMEYPQPITLCPDERSLKSARLVGHLNNKASITTLVDPRFQANRSIVTRANLAAATPADESWVLKAATNDAHGGSLDVYLHNAGDHIELPAFTDVLDEFVVEEYLEIMTNWGLQFHVGADAQARLLAVTEQRVDVVGVYTGGRFGAVTDPPAELLAECLATAQRAADLGYRGLCSLDCAWTRNGRQVLLDLNFRITSGSIPLLALQSVRADILDQPAESVKLTVAGPLTDLLDAVHPALAAGGVLIVAGHDTARTDNPVRQSTLQLLVFGADPDEVTVRRQALETATSR